MVCHCMSLVAVIIQIHPVSLRWLTAWLANCLWVCSGHQWVCLCTIKDVVVVTSVCYCRLAARHIICICIFVLNVLYVTKVYFLYQLLHLRYCECKLYYCELNIFGIRKCCVIDSVFIFCLSFDVLFNLRYLCYFFILCSCTSNVTWTISVIWSRFVLCYSLLSAVSETCRTHNSVFRYSFLFVPFPIHV